MKNSLRMLHASCSIIGLSAVLSFGSAIAQEAAEPEEVVQVDRRLGSVIVTATRREESQQTVPIAVTTFSGDKLEDMTLADTSELGSMTPGLQITASPGGKPFSPQVAIRGQFQNAVNITNDPSVGLYLDDIYVGKDAGSITDLIDVARIEILKGPQGTLFGRNTTGGAIVYVSNMPEFDAMSGSVRASYGNFNSYSAQGVLNLPLGNRVAARFVGAIRGTDGYTKTIQGSIDPVTRAVIVGDTRDSNDLESMSLRGTLLAQPTDRLTLTFIGSYHDKEIANGILNKNLLGDVIGPTPTGFADSQAHQDDFFTGFLSATTAFGAPLDLGHTAEGSRISAKVEYEISDSMTFKAIAGYLETESVDVFDVDGNVLPIVSSNTVQDFEQTSLEFQLAGTAFDDRIDYIAGVYYFSEEGRDLTNSAFTTANPNNPAAPLAAGQIIDGFGENESYSAFAHVKYALDDKSTFQLGVRQTRDEKDYLADIGGDLLFATGIISPCTLVPNGTIVINDGTTCRLDPVPTEDEFLSYTVGVDREFAPGRFVYFRTSRGQRSGGLQNRDFDGTTAPFGPEVLTDYEIGAKLDLADMVRLNLAYYIGEYADIQFTEQVPTQSGATSTVTLNTGSADVQGFEAEALIILPAGFGLEAGYSWSEIDFTNPDTPQFGVPESTFNISATYENSLRIGLLSARLDYSWRDKIIKTTSIAAINANPLLSNLEEYQRLNGRIGLELENGVEIAIFGKNLTEEETYPDLLNFAQRFEVGYTGQPRTYGIEVGFAF